MDLLRTEVIVAFVAIIAVIVGWLLNQLSSTYLLRIDAKRKMKLTLYNLMDIYYLFGWSDTDRIIDVFIDRIRRRWPEANIDQRETRQVKEALTPFFKSLVERIYPEHFAEMKSKYRAALTEIAAIDPFQAFYLSGKENLLGALNHLEQWIQEVKDSSIQEDEVEMFDVTAEFVQREVINKALKSLEGEIKSVAFKIGPFTWLRGRRLIKRLKRQLTKEIEDEIDKYLEKAVSHLASKFAD